MRNFKRNLLKITSPYLLIIFIFANAAYAATTSNTQVSFTIKQPANPLKPVLYDMPSEEICETFLEVNGRAESNVEIYLNGSFQTVTGASDGSFQTSLFLENGQNVFELTAKRDMDFSDITTYTVANNLSCLYTASYAASSTHKDSTDRVNLKAVANHLETQKVGKYIESTLHIKDLSIEPLPGKPEGSEAVSAEEKRPFENAVRKGVEHTFDDMDNDGLSDVIEEVLGFDIYTADSDSDGIKDFDEITIGKKIESDERFLHVNFEDNQQFVCNELILHGEISGKLNSSPADPMLKFCLSGKDNEECFDINVSASGAFAAPLSPKLKEGSYKARFIADETVLDEFDTACTSAKKTADVMISRVDYQNVYKHETTRAVKKNTLFSLSSKPIIKGIGSNHDVVFGFWMQEDKRVSQSVTLSDANGSFETKPGVRLKSVFGFGKASILAYGLNEGEFGGMDTVDFYIFDAFVISLEIVMLIIILVFIRRITKDAKRKKRR